MKVVDGRRKKGDGEANTVKQAGKGKLPSGGKKEKKSKVSVQSPLSQGGLERLQISVGF